MGVEMNANLVGQNLGPYRIVEQIGRGGMATVYKAYEPALDRYVAIKVLPQYFAHDPSFSARFDREAKAVARLNHPNVLPIYSFGQEGGLSYIAMRYVGEGTLKDRLGLPLDLETALDILRQIGQALDYAHRQGIIHRDVKPSNVLIAEGHSQAPGGGNWVLLADFGLARMVESASQLTKSGVGVGTPAYMSPEQGQGTRVDARSDLYSLGVVLYEMLTGRVPYEAETPMAVVLKHITAPLPMPRSLNPTLPGAAERVILKAMAKNAEDRFQTAQEMVEALERALEETTALGWPSGEELEAEPVPPAETVTPAEMLPVEERPAEAVPDKEQPVQAPEVEVPPAETLPVEERVVETPTAEALSVEARPARVPFVKRVPLWTWGAIGLFVVLAAVGGMLIATGGWERLVGRDRTTPTATSESISRATSTSRPPTSTPEPAPPAGPERWVVVGTCDGAVPWQICIHDHGSGEAIQLTDDLDFGEQGVFAWSPDGEQIVFNAGIGPNADGGYNHNLYVINADGSDLRQITEGDVNYLDPSWSPDGEWIASHYGCGLRIIHPDGTGARDLLEGSDDLCVGGTAWSPDGERIVFADWHARDDVHEIWIVGRDGSDPHVAYSFERALEWFITAWSPDGDRLACIYGGEEWSAGFTIGPEGDGDPEQVAEDRLPWHWFPNHRLWEGEWTGIAPAPSARAERWVSAEGCEGEMHVQICIHDHENGEVIQLTHDLDFDGIGRPAWSPDGEQIVFNAGWEDDVSGWHDSKIYAINADGTGLRQITEGDFSDADPSWSPDGEWIALHRNCGLWIVRPDGSDAHELLPGSDDFCPFQTSWSPDSQDIAFINSPPEKNVHELWIVGRNGRDPHVVYTLDTATVWVDAAWSRDHDQLVFIYETENETEGFVIDASSGEPEWLAHDQLPWHWLPYYWPWQDRWADMEPLPPAGPGRSVYVETCEGASPWQICVRDDESGEVIQVTDDLDFGEQGVFAWSPDGEQIVFNAGVGPNADGGYDHNLYVINADGSDLRQITEGDVNYLDPSWSPDGEWIASHHGCGLRIIHPDGTGARDLLEASDDLCVGGTAWSPDSQRIAFVDWHIKDNVQEIWVVGRDGSDPHVVYSFERALEWFITAWSPDGDRLACIYGGEEWSAGFTIGPEGDGDPEQVAEDRLPWHWFPNHRLWEGEWAGIEPTPPAGLGRSMYVETCEGASPPQICVRDENDEVTQVTDDLDFQEIRWWKSWSPDGGQIVFSAGSNAEVSGLWDHKLYIIDADGSDLRQITEGDVNDVDPGWSPDGEWIAFHRDCGLWIVRPDGSGARELLGSTDELCIFDPVWSPDSERIAFLNWSAEHNVHEVWVVGSDGRDPRAVRYFEEPVEWFNVAWSPDGSQLACILGKEDGIEGIAIAPDGSDPRPIPEDELPWTWLHNHWPQWSGGDLPSASGSVPEDPWGLIVIPLGEPIGIGLVADFSGAVSELGPLYENAVRIAIEDQGEIAGFPVGMVVADGGCGEEMGVAAAQVMVGDPSIAGVVGHICSTSCGAALPIYQEARYVMISPLCTATDLSSPGYVVFNRVVLREDQGGDERTREIVATDPYRDFAARYEARYGQPLDSEGLGFSAAYAYDAASILLSAIAEVAVVDSSGALVVGRQSLAEAVRGTPGYPGVTGVIHFDERGDRLP